MTKNSSKMFFLPPNPEVWHTFNRLTQYPFIEVNPKLAQTISRHKKIRFLNQIDNKKKVIIRQGIIGIPPQVKIKKNGNGFDFFFF